ncbi:hypothetical protein KO481_42155 [Nocardia sp. NEAU-G5]|uniref:Aminoglycoside phosphotransferase n=1 Tax=Nocardia albiluteola TaxID=2842303 RepID=A0ABS6BD88_9NOCA|nr:hypothetical protein [Nocardia albiluteola]MBU3068108.1 hypothetical protein [Nocardia albiluteola]
MVVDPTAADLSGLSPSAVSLRQSWDALSANAIVAIEARTGPIREVRPARLGYSSHIAATLRTARGHVFVKGLRTEHPAARTQECEAAVNPHIVPIGPKLLWRIGVDGWDVLGFEYLEGRGADYGAESGDLSLVVDLMTELGAVTGGDVPVPRAEQRWARHLPAAGRALVHGDSLLHTDWHHTNVLVPPTGSARLVDWAVATRGAAWIDPACWVVWLVYAGHSPDSAERWAARVPAWRCAEATTLDAFARVLAAHWHYIAENHPNRMTAELRDAAAQWAAHRRRARQ